MDSYRLPVRFTPICWETTEFETTAVCVAVLRRVSTQSCGGNASPHTGEKGCGISTGLHNQKPVEFVDVSSEQQLCDYQRFFIRDVMNLPAFLI